MSSTQITELVLRTVDGDELAFARLCRELDSILEKQAHRFYAPGLDHDDLKQEARIALHAACLSWDGRAGSFPGFASMAIGRRLSTAVRMAHAHKHDPINTGARFEHPVKAGTETALLQEIVAGPDHHDPAHIAQVRADLGTVVDAVRTQLTDIEVTVLARRLNGQTLGQAGHGLGRSHQGPAKVADNAMQRVRHKLGDALAA